MVVEWQRVGGGERSPDTGGEDIQTGDGTEAEETGGRAEEGGYLGPGDDGSAGS